jgi:hypothetical protein
VPWELSLSGGEDGDDCVCEAYIGKPFGMRVVHVPQCVICMLAGAAVCMSDVCG